MKTNLPSNYKLALRCGGNYLNHSKNQFLVIHLNGVLGAVTRFAEQLYIEDSNSECLVRLLKFLDKAYASDDNKLKELISISFLENLSRDEKSFEGIRAMLSVRLEGELSKYD